MKDYFSEFIVRRNPRPTLGTAATKPPAIVEKTPLQTHLRWAAITGGVALLAFKGGGWYYDYQRLKKIG